MDIDSLQRRRQRRQAANRIIHSMFNQNDSRVAATTGTTPSSTTTRRKSTAQPRPVIAIPPRGIGPIAVPNQNDVLCGRGGRINTHSGNLQFRELVALKKVEYLSPTTKKLQKAHIAASIVTKIRSMDPPGRFLKEERGGEGADLWWDIGDAKAIKKCGQALREDAPEIRIEIEGGNMPSPVSATTLLPAVEKMRIRDSDGESSRPILPAKKLDLPPSSYSKYDRPEHRVVYKPTATTTQQPTPYWSGVPGPLGPIPYSLYPETIKTVSISKSRRNISEAAMELLGDWEANNKRYPEVPPPPTRQLPDSRLLAGHPASYAPLSPNGIHRYFHSLDLARTEPDGYLTKSGERCQRHEEPTPNTNKRTAPTGGATWITFPDHAPSQLDNKRTPEERLGFLDLAVPPKVDSDDLESRRNLADSLPDSTYNTNAVGDFGRHLVTATTFPADDIVSTLRGGGATTEVSWCSLHHESLCRSAEVNSDLAFVDRNASKLAERDFALKAVAVRGHTLRTLPRELRSDREIVLAAVKHTGIALRYAMGNVRGDKEVVLAAVSNTGVALVHASGDLRDDRSVVLAAVSHGGMALAFASDRLKADKDIVLTAVQVTGLALEHASDSLRADKDTVLMAVTQNGNAFEFASEALRADKDIICKAVAKNPEMLKYAIDGLSQDPECWVAAGLWSEGQVDKEKIEKSAMRIVLSTRFSLQETSTSKATIFTKVLHNHPFFRDGDFLVYSPNAYNKCTCDPEWTRMEWPCRGTFETCKKDSPLKVGTPTSSCCWRYSFRHQLKEAKRTRGFMIQVVDLAGEPRLYEPVACNYQLGDGQKIESAMAREVGTKVFRIYRPRIVNSSNGQYLRDFQAKHIDILVAHVKTWQEGNCADMTECEVHLGGTPG